MKKIIALILSASLVLGSLAGCGNSKPAAQPAPQPAEQQLSIVTTVFPEYDWVRNITNGNENVERRSYMTRREQERNLRSYPMALTVPEVAEILRVCTKTVYKLIKDSDIPSVKVGREIRISKARLIDYIQHSA